ncbi:hypothetical protein HTY61_12935 [Oricola thermophila]|uniref:Uncharacterized protein n=1 Tax=Oricola thermophila TaxID=2742145 RepID=A0A6N1VIS1_9HYPH|nr:hypothetical protein HTY61_12935 [Oricola thermophila]
MRKQYHFRPSPGGGFYAWDVSRLIELASDLPVTPVPLSEIAELHENWWFQTDDAVPTPAAMLRHFALMHDTDLRHPILLCAQGRVMDGMHRIMKAAWEGRAMLGAKRFEETPPPDHANVMPDDLDYD